MRSYCAVCGESYLDENMYPCDTCGKWVCYRCDSEHSPACRQRMAAVMPIPEGGGKESNLRTVQRLRQLMERTLASREEWKQLAAGDLQAEAFLQRYYRFYLHEILTLRMADLLEGSAARLQYFLVESTNLVFRERFQTDRPHEMTQDGLTNRQGCSLGDENQQVGIEQKKIFQKHLAREIILAFNQPDEAQAAIDDFKRTRFLGVLQR